MVIVARETSHPWVIALSSLASAVHYRWAWRLPQPLTDSHWQGSVWYMGERGLHSSPFWKTTTRQTVCQSVSLRVARSAALMSPSFFTWFNIVLWVAMINMDGAQMLRAVKLCGNKCFRRDKKCFFFFLFLSFFDMLCARCSFLKETELRPLEITQE